MARESTGPAVRLRGLETNAECRPLGRFVEAVAESAHDAQHADVAGGGEFELERHGAFDAGAARFVGVLRRGLEDDLDRPIDGLRHRCHGRLGGRTRPLIEPRRLHLAGPFAAPRGAGAPLLNPPVVTAPGPFAASRGEAAALPNPPVVTAAAAWLVRAPFVRSNRPVSGGRWITGFSMGRSTAAGTSGAGAGSTGLATIGATGSGFGTSALASSRIGAAGPAEQEGAAPRQEPTATSPVGRRQDEHHPRSLARRRRFLGRTNRDDDQDDHDDGVQHDTEPQAGGRTAVRARAQSCVVEQN